MKSLLVLVIAVGALFGLYALGRRLETNQAEPVRGDLSARRGSQPTIVFDGKSYVYNDSLETILFIGIDRNQESGESEGTFRNGGQADMLLLLVIDPRQKTVTPLQIDRDTIAEITILGVLGRVAGTRDAQICLSHGFGDGKAQSCEFTAEAVERLLCGIDIGQYIALHLDSISVLNDAVGGVTVTLDDDFTAYDQTMTTGATIQLSGDQAELFVRYRYQVGDGTNASRMRRQRAYLSALMDMIIARTTGDANYIGMLYDALGTSMITDMKRGKLINTVHKVSGCAIGDVITLIGEHVTGGDGFVEFHAEETALQQLVLDIFYKQVNP